MDEKIPPALRSAGAGAHARAIRRPPQAPRPFILLNIPKTGTRYTVRLIRTADALNDARRLGLDSLALRNRSALRAIRRLSLRLRLRRILRSGCLSVKEHHTPYHQQPSRLRGLPAISTLREPLAWHVSRYLHVTSGRRAFPGKFALRDLEEGAHSPEPSRRELYRSFIAEHLGGEITAQAWSGVSLEAYWRFLRDSRKMELFIDKEFNVRLAEDFPLGFLGCRALTFIHRDPGRVFAMPAREAEEYFLSGRWREGLCDIRFLRQERLREDLYAALEQLGHRKQTLDAALELTPEKVNTARPEEKERARQELEQNPRLREEILHSERIYSQCILPLAGNFLND